VNPCPTQIFSEITVFQDALPHALEDWNISCVELDPRFCPSLRCIRLGL
jgi:hypothetical protein